MAKFVSINGIEIELKKKKTKSLHLYVRQDGRVILSVPYRVREADAIRFARSNIAWIEKQKNKMAELPGKEYYVARKAELDAKISRLLPIWEDKTGLKCDSWHTRYMTSRWGSCIPDKKRLCFNLQLVDKPQECLEYVILHELVHLKYPGHGGDFKYELGRYMPDWKRFRSMLRN